MAWSKKNKQPIPQPSELAVAIATAMDNTDAVSADQLLAETGKTRQQILDVVMADDEVLSCLDDIDGAIKAEKWRLYAPNTELDEAIVNDFYSIVRTLMDDFIALAVLTKLNGYGVAEYTYEQDDNGFCYIKEFLSKDGELDKYTPKRDGSVTVNVNGVDIAIEQTVKHIVLKSKAVPARPYGEMMIIRAYPAVALRRKEWAYLGQFITRYAVPYVIGKQGGFGVTLENFTRKIFSFVSGGAIGVGKDDDISLHQLSGNGDAFKTAEQMANSRIQKLLLGRVKTSELTTGSRAAQETDDKLLKGRVNAYLSLVTKTVQHAINAMLIVNQSYGITINAPQGIVFEFESQAKLDKTLAETAKTYSEIDGFEFTDDFFLNVVGLEKSHFNFVPKSQSASQAQQPPVGQQFSYNLSNQHFRLSTLPTANDVSDKDVNKIGKAKLDAIMALLSDSDDYGQFSQRIDEMSLPDGGMVQDLSDKTTDAFVKGLDGYQNANGENQL